MCISSRAALSRRLRLTGPFFLVLLSLLQMLHGDEFELGSGAFSVVRRAVVRATGKPVAVKLLIKDSMKCRDHKELVRLTRRVPRVAAPHSLTLPPFPVVRVGAASGCS